MRHLLLFLGICSSAFAHVGSPDVFYEGNAGPYHVLVTIRPPAVIPGVAEIEVRCNSNDVTQVRIVPLPLRGPGAKFAPTPDVAQRSKDDPEFYTGSLWMMGFGSWQVRVHVDGGKGQGETSIPVPALATRSTTMDKSLGMLLAGLCLFLMIGIVSIVGAGVREAQLDPGAIPGETNRRRSRIVMAVSLVAVAAVGYLGNQWWNSEAHHYARRVYKPIQMTGTVESGRRLVLHLEDTGFFRFNKLDDLVPDHGHLMHLFVVSDPAMDRMWHLHPEQAEPGSFTLDLPAIPAGKYRLFADIVHASGIPETGATVMEIPAVEPGKPLSGDDSAAAGSPVSQADLNRTEAPLSGGYRMVWQRDAAALKAKRAYLFHFRVEDQNGRPAENVELYMGMPGHAEFVGNDFQVFAHVHPSGSAPMAAFGILQAASKPDSKPGAVNVAREVPSMGDMQGMQAMPAVAMPPEVSFPYGFPKPGNYRMFVQVKRAGKVETGIFDTRVE